MALFNEKELSEISNSLEKFLVVSYCLLNTMDMALLPIVKSLAKEIRSPLVNTKSSFGIGYSLVKGPSNMSIYDIDFVITVINNENKNQSISELHFQDNKSFLYNSILSLQKPSLKSHVDIMMIGYAICLDFYSINS